MYKENKEKSNEKKNHKKFQKIKQKHTKTDKNNKNTMIIYIQIKNDKRNHSF